MHQPNWPLQTSLSATTQLGFLTSVTSGAASQDTSPNAPWLSEVDGPIWGLPVDRHLDTTLGTQNAAFMA